MTVNDRSTKPKIKRSLFPKAQHKEAQTLLQADINSSAEGAHEARFLRTSSFLAQWKGSSQQSEQSMKELVALMKSQGQKLSLDKLSHYL